MSNADYMTLNIAVCLTDQKLGLVGIKKGQVFIIIEILTISGRFTWDD